MLKSKKWMVFQVKRRVKNMEKPVDLQSEAIVYHLGRDYNSSTFSRSLIFMLMVIAFNFLILHFFLGRIVKESDAVVLFPFLAFMNLLFFLEFLFGCESITVFETHFEVRYLYKTVFVRFSDLKDLKIKSSPFNPDFDMVWKKKNGRWGRCSFIASKEYIQSIDEFKKKLNEQLNKNGVFLSLLWMESKKFKLKRG